MTHRNRNSRFRNTFTPRGLGAIAATAALCAFALSPSAAPSRALLVWNATASAPIGLYRVGHSRVLARGDLVLAVPAAPLGAFADARGYLPHGVPLVKRIAAVAGDTVCARGNAILINGRIAAQRLAADGEGRPLAAWEGCRKLRSGEVFLLMADVRSSFDGRYFGLTPTSQIAGTLKPIWTR